METQVKSARPKQKNYRKTSDRDERKPSSGPASEPEYARRLFAPASNKRAAARFAKGPSDTGGFSFPRHLTRVEVEPAWTTVLESQPLARVATVSVEKSEPISEIVEQTVVESPIITTSELVLDSAEPISYEPIQDPSENFEVSVPISDTFVSPSSEYPEPASPEPFLANDEKQTNHEELSVDTLPSMVDNIVHEEPVNEIQEFGQTNNDVSQKVLVEETDDTVGPGDRSSDSESSEEEENIPAPIKPNIPTKSLKPTATPSIVRKTPGSITPAFRKIMPVTSPAVTPRSSWSKFLPLVIEIKATIPYPMHLLGITLLLVTGLLLRLLYQFGADLSGEIDLQAQFVRLAKLGLLFFVVALCVNFVEDNKELQQKVPISPAQPKLRPSKMSKNKKKMMMKV